MGRGQGAQDVGRGPRTEDRGPRTEDRGQVYKVLVNARCLGCAPRSWLAGLGLGLLGHNNGQWVSRHSAPVLVLGGWLGGNWAFYYTGFRSLQSNASSQLRAVVTGYSVE